MASPPTRQTTAVAAAVTGVDGVGAEGEGVGGEEVVATGGVGETRRGEVEATEGEAGAGKFILFNTADFPVKKLFCCVVCVGEGRDCRIK